MHSLLKSLLAASAVAFVAAAPAQAQLLLSGTSYGAFVDPGLTHTLVNNGPVTSVFESGVPYRPFAPYNHTTTAITFDGASFSDVGAGDQLDLGAIEIRNGVTLLGTTASWAAMDLYLNLPEHGVVDFKLTTLLFSIDNTANGGGMANVPDLFLVGHSAINPLLLGGSSITFDLHLSHPEFATGAGASIAEGSLAELSLYATFEMTPVPEPSTYALCAAVLLVGFVALRRYRAGTATAC
jgi:PEP-CTERM putative exosortase interaction domain